MSQEIHVEAHSSPIKTPKQLIVVVVLSFVVPITLIAVLAHLVMSSAGPGKDNAALTEEAIAKRLHPVGEVSVDPNQPKPEPVAATPAPAPVAAATPAAPVAASSGASTGKGKATYDTTCMACHATGVAGAPKAGDKAAWAPRLKTGMEALYTSVLKGKNAMPPKGGNLSLADADVKAAADYMVGLVK